MLFCRVYHSSRRSEACCCKSVRRQVSFSSLRFLLMRHLLLEAFCDHLSRVAHCSTLFLCDTPYHLKSSSTFDCLHGCGWCISPQNVDLWRQGFTLSYLPLCPQPWEQCIPIGKYFLDDQNKKSLRNTLQESRGPVEKRLPLIRIFVGLWGSTQDLEVTVSTPPGLTFYQNTYISRWNLRRLE